MTNIVNNTPHRIAHNMKVPARRTFGVTMSAHVKICSWHSSAVMTSRPGEIIRACVDDFESRISINACTHSSIRLIDVQNKQDFEREEQQLYDIELAIAGDPEVAESKRVRLTVAVLNIVDNAPAISIDGPCVVDELLSGVDAKCKFTVYHLDGIKDNPFQMSITGRGFGEERKFGFSAPFNEQTYSREYSLM